MTAQVFGIDLDRRSIAILLGLVGFGILGVVAFNFTYPKLTEVQSLTDQLTQAQTNLTQSQAIKAKLADVPAKLAKAQQGFTNLTTLLPKEVSPSILLIDIARIVKGSGASLVQYTPGKPAVSGEVPGLTNLYKSTSKVSISGTFSQVLGALKDLERLEQLLKVENIAVTPDGKGSGVLTVAFELSSYALTDAAPTNAAAPAPTQPEAKDNPKALSDNPAFKAQPAK